MSRTRQAHRPFRHRASPRRPIDISSGTRSWHRFQLTAAMLVGATLVATSCGAPVESDASNPAPSDSAIPDVSDAAIPSVSDVAIPDVSVASGTPSPLSDAVSSFTATPELRLAAPTQPGQAATGSPINDVTVDADQRVATATSDGVVGLYDLSGSSPTPVSLVHPEGHVDGVAFDPHGGRLATGVAERREAAAFDDTVSFWDITTAERLIHVGGEANAVEGCSSFRNIVDWSHDGTFVTSTSHDFTVSMIDPDTGRTLHTFAPHANTVLDTAISPDDRLLVTSGDDSTMRVWDLQTKELIADRPVTMGGYWSMVFLPGGTSLVVSDIVGNVWVIDALSGETVTTFDGSKLRRGSIAVSPDGRLVASGADGSVVRVWSAQTGKILADLVGQEGPVSAVAFFADGERLVSGAQDGTAIVWRYTTT